MKNILKNKINRLWILFLLAGLSACETDITLDLPKGTEKLVVEGHIEPGRPPMVLLTRSLPYFSSTSLADMDQMFVHNAVMTISDGTVTKNMIEINLASLPDSIIQLLRNVYQINIDTGSAINYAFYTSFEMLGEEGKKYKLHIEAGGKTVNAVTQLTRVVIPDSFWFVKYVNRKKDTLYELKFRFQDPVNEENFYTYSTSINHGQYFPPPYGSVMDDKMFNGIHVTYSMMRGQSSNDTINRDDFGYFFRGDTVHIKFCTMDKAHYEFWSTLESDNTGGSPFSSPVLVKSNVVGGLGIWGGYGSYYRTLYVPK